MASKWSGTLAEFITIMETAKLCEHVTTGKKYRLCELSNGGYILVDEATDEEIKSFALNELICSIEYKFEDGSVVKLAPGQFIPFSMDNKPTHSKYEYQHRFVKL